jgi:hypothetical protein
MTSLLLQISLLSQPRDQDFERPPANRGVGRGVAEIGHTASFYWQGKQPAAAYFTTVPFGLTPNEHVAWIEAGGGQALWDDLYRPFGVKPFMGGNTGRLPAQRRRVRDRCGRARRGWRDLRAGGCDRGGLGTRRLGHEGDRALSQA